MTWLQNTVYLRLLNPLWSLSVFGGPWSETFLFTPEPRLKTGGDWPHTTTSLDFCFDGPKEIRHSVPVSFFKSQFKAFFLSKGLPWFYKLFLLVFQIQVCVCVCLCLVALLNCVLSCPLFDWNCCVLFCEECCCLHYYLFFIFMIIDHGHFCLNKITLTPYATLMLHLLVFADFDFLSVYLAFLLAKGINAESQQSCWNACAAWLHPVINHPPAFSPPLTSQIVLAYMNPQLTSSSLPVLIFSSPQQLCDCRQWLLLLPSVQTAS